VVDVLSRGCFLATASNADVRSALTMCDEGPTGGP
jgi:hypothetical protein